MDDRTEVPAPGSWSVDLQFGPWEAPVARRVAQALGPESGEGVPRTHVGVEETAHHEVRVHVRAPSTSGLRAALNAHLRWVELALQIDGWVAGGSSQDPRPEGPGR